MTQAGTTSRDIRLAMRARWAARVTASGDRARAWATAAAELLRSAEPAGGAAAATSRDGPAGQPSARARLTSPGRRHQALPGPPRASAAAKSAAESWQAEADWWRRVEADGRVLLRSSASDSDPVLGAVVVMAADARRVLAALGSAARGGLALEAYDAVA